MSWTDFFSKKPQPKIHHENPDLIAPVTFLCINGKFFKAAPESHLNHIPYICTWTQQIVKLRYSGFYKAWQIFGDELGDVPYYIMTDNLNRPIDMKEEKIPHYLTDKQNEALGNYILSSMLAAEKKNQ